MSRLAPFFSLEASSPNNIANMYGVSHGLTISPVCRAMLWVCRDQEAVLLVDSVIRGEGKMGPQDGHRRGPRPWRPTEANVREAADLLISTSLSRGTGDNVTAVVVCWDE